MFFESKQEGGGRELNRKEGEGVEVLKWKELVRFLALGF